MVYFGLGLFIGNLSEKYCSKVCSVLGEESDSTDSSGNILLLDWSFDYETQMKLKSRVQNDFSFVSFWVLRSLIGGMVKTYFRYTLAKITFQRTAVNTDMLLADDSCKQTIFFVGLFVQKGRESKFF